MTTTLPRILYCHCAHAQVVRADVKQAVLTSLLESNAPFEAVGDLCELAARKDGALAVLAQGGAVKIAACYPRAVKWLFAAGQALLEPGATEVLNMRVQEAAEITGALLRAEVVPNLPAGKKFRETFPAPVPPRNNGELSGRGSLQVFLEIEAHGQAAAKRLEILSMLLDRGYAVRCIRSEDRIEVAGPALVLGNWPSARGPGPQPVSALPAPQYLDFSQRSAGEVAELVESVRAEVGASRPGDWKPWFPVIDYDRCTDCMQCLSFCLFGVYGVNDRQHIQVQQSAACKTNCPACSRVCPEAAIIFPKYQGGPINGDAVNNSDVEREKMKIDISALLGGDIYSLLRERSERAQSRFSKERDADKALAERQRCLAKLIASAQIPPEVLMSLPSPEEIARKAEEARAAARRALRGGATPS